VIFEELGRESPGVAIAGIVQMVFAPVMLLSDTISARYLEKVIAGECLLAGAFRDPAGVANYTEQPNLAVRDGDDYVLNGTRLWVTQGTFYDVMGIAGMVHGRQRLFYVERGHPGVTVSPTQDGIRSSLGHGHLDRLSGARRVVHRPRVHGHRPHRPGRQRQRHGISPPRLRHRARPRPRRVGSDC
jgi:alkylation response protein AidB-like acyl-CoA dehydrogenase